MNETTTDDQIRRWIAVFMGWTNLREERNVTRDVFKVLEVPDYLNDLNAMYGIEQELERRDLWEPYVRSVRVMMPPDREFYRSVFAVLHASARERALAAYRTITALEQKEPTE